MRWLKNKEVALIQVMNALLLLVVGIVFLYDPATVVQLTALIGTVWLATLLIAPKLLKMKSLKPLHKDLLQISRNSKWMGIWTAIWFWLHGLLVLFVYLDISSTAAVIGSILQRETVLGTICLLILLLLLTISNTWSYQHIKLWKQLNMLVWLVVPLGFTYALLASLRFTGQWPMPAVLVLFPLMGIVGIVALFRKDADYFARFRFLLIIGGSIAGLLVAYLY